MGEAKRRKQLDPNFGKPCWRFDLPKERAVYLTGDAILAHVQLRSRGRVWDGDAIYSGDTADGFSILLKAYADTAEELFGLQCKFRGKIGRDLTQFLVESGFLLEPRPKAKTDSDSASGFEMSLLAILPLALR